jgi:D-3-phosphoglycerate dehydrogenase / 2-oxoglutarate reductase
LPQVILTPHMGSYAKEARIQMEQEAAQNLFDSLVNLGLAE